MPRRPIFSGATLSPACPPCGRQSWARGVWLMVVLLAVGCKSGDDTILLVTADLMPRGQTAGATTLSVVVRDSASKSDSHSFSPRGGLSFPTSFSLQLPRDVQGPISLMVQAMDGNEAVLAEGLRMNLTIQVGKRQDTSIDLICKRGCLAAVADGGTDGGTDAAIDAPTTGRVCGNGAIDDMELCDPGIANNRPGACPRADCDDWLPCTVDRPMGTACKLTCEHTPITAALPGDRCCPAGATSAEDPDCSATCGNGKVDMGEACDLTIPAGQAGACPTAPSCDDRDPCSTDVLLSAGTCAARCAHYPILTPAAGDMCCPPGGTSDSDPDCPVVCGNRRRDQGETCDRSAPAESGDACPTACVDTDPCTTDVVVGSGCQLECRHVPITQLVGGDRCCPPGGTRELDSDCPALCGNGIVEPGETCDRGITLGQPGACPLSCAASTQACLIRRLDGRAEDCSARCTEDLVKACASQADGCCPADCAVATDPDCSATCGNGVVESSESCDRVIADGSPGACPRTCSDGNSCTTDLLISSGTCQARCVFSPIDTPRSGDGCCAPGSNALLDADCAAVCGNRLVETPGETCDSALALGIAGACPTSCPELPRGCLQPRLVGNVAACTSLCQLETIKTCHGGDGCCPSGCSPATDQDCVPVCGNGVVEAGEACDRGITAGNTGHCPALCDDRNACTTDVILGRRVDCTRTCRNDPVTTCQGGDGCCPPGCTPEQDRDCNPNAICGNSMLEKGETCDPPSRCPTSCPDDGDPCTADRLLGDAATCNARCEHTFILTCSGATSDRCCPTGCMAGLDVDCEGAR